MNKKYYVILFSICLNLACQKKNPVDYNCKQENDSAHICKLNLVQKVILPIRKQICGHFFKENGELKVSIDSLKDKKNSTLLGKCNFYNFSSNERLNKIDAFIKNVDQKKITINGISDLEYQNLKKEFLIAKKENDEKWPLYFRASQLMLPAIIRYRIAVSSKSSSKESIEDALRYAWVKINHFEGFYPREKERQPQLKLLANFVAQVKREQWIPKIKEKTIFEHTGDVLRFFTGKL